MDMLTVMVTGAVAQPCMLDAAGELRVMYKVVHDPLPAVVWSLASCLVFWLRAFLAPCLPALVWLFACLPLSGCSPACPPAYCHQQYLHLQMRCCHV